MRLELESQLKEAELWYKNAYNMYRRALDEYKVAEYADILNRKKNYIREEIFKRKADIIKDRLLKSHPSIKPDKLQKAIEQEINKEAEIIFEKEKKDIQKLIIGEIAFDVLAQEERTAEEMREVINSVKMKNANFFNKLWERYKALPYGKKALIGAAIAGVGGGIIGVAGGAGFAALKVGATMFGRRFFGGFMVGGGVKVLADKLIKRKENKTLITETNKKVEQISNEIANLINNPDKTPQTYEQWIDMADQLDNRLDEVLIERDKIRAQHDKKRRTWTLIASLIGGVAANADNIYALFHPHASPTGGGVPTETVTTKTETVITKIEKLPPPSKHIWDILNKHSVFPSVRVGREGFWGAAQIIKKQLGMSDELFAKAWSNAQVIDPISNKIFKMPQAHWVFPLKPDQQALLTYNANKNVFEAIIAPKIKIGGAEDLINAYKQLGKEVPLGVAKSILRGLGQE